jgi:hypothetical protein
MEGQAIRRCQLLKLCQCTGHPPTVFSYHLSACVPIKADVAATFTHGCCGVRSVEVVWGSAVGHYTFVWLVDCMPACGQGVAPAKVWADGCRRLSAATATLRIGCPLPSLGESQGRFNSLTYHRVGTPVREWGDLQVRYSYSKHNHECCGEQELVSNIPEGHARCTVQQSALLRPYVGFDS